MNRAAKLGLPRSRKPARPGRESPIVTAILKALAMKGVWAWRVNSSMTVFKAQAGHARRVVKGAPAGSPDILLIIPRKLHRLSVNTFISEGVGQLGGIEVKTNAGKQSATQKRWQRQAEAFGVRYGVARGIGEALRLVEMWSTT